MYGVWWGVFNGSALGEGLIGVGDVMWAVAMDCFSQAGQHVGLQCSRRK